MSFFEDASLVLIPSGIKNAKVYSVKPTDGTGDLTFSRASSATRVQSDGLIEKVRTNLALYSEQFDNASWTKNAGATITANTTTAPDGTLTAETLNVATTIFSGLVQTFTTSTNSWTTSLFVKKGTKDFIYLFDPSTNRYAWFNLTTGAVGQKTASTEAAIISVGNGWFRVSVTAAVTGSASHFIQFGLSDADGSFTPASTGTAFIWGAQAEVSDFGATDYIATTTAAVSVGPVSGLPRLDYLGSTCPRLLLEPQRTNTQINSENFAAWLGSDNITIGSNTSDTLDPAGFNGADKITLLGGAPMRVYEFTGSTAGTGTISLFAKAGTSTNIALFTSSGTLLVGFNLTTQVVTPSAGTGTITNYGNGWYRITATSTLGASEVLQITFVGSNGQTIYIYGAQVEAGAYATSYIPTLGASVTRVAESSSSASIPSLFGTTEGSFFIELTHDGRNASGSIPLFLRSSVTSSFNQATYLQFGNSDIVLNVYSGGTNQVAMFGGSFTNGQTLKVAFAYKVNDFVMYVNGVQIGTDTSGAISTSLSFIDLGSYLSLQSTFQYDGKISQALLFKTRLTNSQLAELTA